MGKMLAMQLKTLLAPLIDNLQHEKNVSVSAAQLAALSSYVDNLAEDTATSPPAHFSLSALSLREMQIARLIKDHMTNEEIAAQLYISPETVRTHRRNIRKKLGIRGTKARLHGHLLTLSGNALATDLSEQSAPSNGNHRHMLCPTERLSILQEMGVVG
jgi:DNA-binding CsgD family transcriptional regulator